MLKVKSFQIIKLVVNLRKELKKRAPNQIK